MCNTEKELVEGKIVSFSRLLCGKGRGVSNTEVRKNTKQFTSCQ